MNDYNDPTPAEVIRETWRWFPAALCAGIAVIILFAVLGVFVWHIGGVFQAKTIQRNYSNTVNSQGYQSNLLSEMQRNLANITGPGGLSSTRASLPASSPEQEVVRSQELAQIGKFCSEGAQLNFGAIPGGPDMQVIYNANCQAGTVIANPPLAPAAS
jgi:hypothetical protein